MNLPEYTIPGEDVPCEDTVMRAVDSNHNVRIFTEDEIRRITRNYSTLIGKGGFGEVYQGIFDDIYDIVAVKRYIRKELREEFMEEVNIHSKMCHKNVVKLIGYCIGESTLTMVTEYISRGNLDDMLHNSNSFITLDSRLGIAIGSAEALSYMHSMHLSINSLVCHGDIKPANILLDENLVAKVSDFGLSRLLSGGISRYTKNVKGSLDYMDPIYLREGRVTPRSDTYSFGSVLLELIARKRVKQGDINLIVAFSSAYKERKGLKELFDVDIANERNMKILEELGKLAIECLTVEIGKRPQMSDVAERLLMLRKFQNAGYDNTSWRFFWGVQNARPTEYKHERSLSTSSTVEPVRKGKSFAIFKRNSGNFDILKELGNVRIFTKAELDEATQNYSCLIGESLSSEVYKGALEDNTKVAVKKFIGKHDDLKVEFINGGMVLSQIVHKSIIKLLGCCMDDYTPILVYEHAAKGSLYNILNGMDQFLPNLRLKIAVKIAEALEYLHSTATGIIGHGYIVPSKILLDDNFMPKLSGFSSATRVNMENKNNVTGCFPRNMTCDDQSVMLKIRTDVYQFGVLLSVLISRKNYKFYEDHDHLIFECVTAYEDNNRGRAFFDEDITAEEDITVLEAMGRLELRCTCSEPNNIPTIKEVVEHLWMIRRSWKRSFGEATLESETDTITSDITEA